MRYSRKKLDKMRAERLGCLTLRTARSMGTLVGLYRASEAKLDPDGGEYVTICEEHGTLCNHRTYSIALDALPSPESWCDECRAS